MQIDAVTLWGRDVQNPALTVPDSNTQSSVAATANPRKPRQAQGQTDLNEADQKVTDWMPSNPDLETAKRSQLQIHPRPGAKGLNECSQRLMLASRLEGMVGLMARVPYE